MLRQWLWQRLACSYVEAITLTRMTAIKGPRPAVAAGETLLATETHIDRIVPGSHARRHFAENNQDVPRAQRDDQAHSRVVAF